MQKDKLSKLRDIVVKNCKIVFPVIVVAVVAFTVVIALNLNREREQNQNGSGEDGIVSSEDPTEEQVAVPEEVPLVENEDAEIANLVQTFYTARETGDKDTLSRLYDVILTEDLQRYEEWSKYLDHYSDLQIYTKQGPEAGSVVAYVYYKVYFTDYEDGIPGSENMYICRNDEGQLYIKNFNIMINFTESENDYIETLNEQDDIIEFNNRVEVEFQDLIRQKPEMLNYIAEVGQVVQENVGQSLADQHATGSNDDPEGSGGEQEIGNESVETQEPPVDTTPEYATATTTVNVRSSDSEKAEKLGQVTAGTRLQVQEVRVNGWTKIVYQGADGYIKSEFLQFAENAAGQQVIGTVTATTNINVRASASQSAEKLGVLPGGESLDLLAVEGEWCKIIFAGQVGYVKAEFVQQNQ